MAAILLATSRGFHPRTLTYFSLVGKVGKSTHRDGTLSMGSLPYVPHPRDDTKGGSRPPCGIPHGPYGYFCFLWILPWVRYKKIVLPRTPRNMSPFNRAVAEVSLTARL